MPIPSSGPITFSNLQSEFGGANPIGLGEYYAGGSFVAAGTGGNSGAIPSSGTLPISRFYGSAAAGVVWGSRFLRPGLVSNGNPPGAKIKYINNRFFIVGDQNNPSLTYSSDYTGTSWTTTSLPILPNYPTILRDIEWNGSIYVAVGQYLYSATNSIVTSPDLVNWTPRNVEISRYSITTNGSLFVVPGGTNLIKTSPDGITWTNRAITGTVNDVLWNGFVFVGVGQNGTTVYSQDGITWTSGTGAGTDTLYTVAWGNNTFVATSVAGNCVYTSPNGVTWTRRTHTSVSQGGTITYGAGRFVRMGWTGAEYLYSSDGISWTYRTFIGEPDGFSGSGLSDPALIKAIKYGIDRFIGVGAGLVISSTDGLSWTSVSSGSVPRGSLRAVASNGTTIVAVGDSGRNSFNRTSNKPTLIISSDGNNWNHVNTNALTTLTYSDLYDVIWTGTRFIAGGGPNPGFFILTSEDGTSWTSRAQNNVNGRIVSIALKGGRIIALSEGNAWISDDGGLNWTTNNFVSGTGIAANSSIFARVVTSGGSAGINYSTSSDGTTWSSTTTIPSTANRTVNKIKWVNDRFFICGRNPNNSGAGYIMYSLDGTTWNNCSTPDATGAAGITNFYDVSYSFGRYFAVSNRGIFVSTNGIAFSLLSGYSISAGSGFMPLLGITNTSNKIVAVGLSGAVVTSPPPNATTL